MDVKIKKIALLLLIICCLPFACAIESPQASFLDGMDQLRGKPRLMINNRPLAKINGRVISLYDVVKKMDLFFYEYDPNYELSSPEKYQFYMSRWEETLDEMIALELILLDAKQKEIKIGDGEVRLELEERFGPNIMSNLDKVGLSYEEARELLRNELTTSQLIGMKVHSKAFQYVTPQVIKKAYESYLKEHPPVVEWKYRVLSFRSQEMQKCEAVANRAYSLLTEAKKEPEEVVNALNEEGVSIHLSEEYMGSSQKISKTHLEVIETLKPDLYSAPIIQKNRSRDQGTLLRIFHLQERSEKLPETFEVMHDSLKNQLLFKTADEAKKEYIDRLKHRFGYDKHQPKFELPEDYHPFVII